MKGFGSAEFDRRQYPRLDFALPLAFQDLGQSPPEGVSKNVSLGGMMACFPREVSPSQILDLTMLLPVGEDKQVCRVQAEVVWVKKGDFEGGWSCQAGIRFVNMTPESEKIWRDFLVLWQGEK